MNTYTYERNEIHQRMIDEAYDHIISTGVQSTDGAKCLYGGSGCAFAPMIKDGKHSELDNKIGCNSISTVYENFPELLHDWTRDACPTFANLLQYCHDTCLIGEGDRFLREFNERLRNLCKYYNYTFPGDKA